MNVHALQVDISIFLPGPHDLCLCCLLLSAAPAPCIPPLLQACPPQHPQGRGPAAAARARRRPVILLQNASSALASPGRSPCWWGDAVLLALARDAGGRQGRCSRCCRRQWHAPCAWSDSVERATTCSVCASPTGACWPSPFALGACPFLLTCNLPPTPTPPPCLQHGSSVHVCICRACAKSIAPGSPCPMWKVRTCMWQL